MAADSGVRPMYNEKQDFLDHAREVRDFVQCLNDKGGGINGAITVLDLGAGQGMHAGFLGMHFRDVYCSDVIDYTSLYRGEFFKLLEGKYKRNGYSIDLPRTQFIKTDAMRLIYRDDYFDCIVSINAFEHIPDPERALDEMIRCTRPDGRIYIQFDPVWTADTGSHFFHRVPEPWSHLIYTDDEYCQRMRSNGATEEEEGEYRRAMNRRRVDYYEHIIDTRKGKKIVDILAKDFWNGLVDEKHAAHPFYTEAIKKGFGKEELLVRGGRYLLKVRK